MFLFEYKLYSVKVSLMYSLTYPLTLVYLY